VFLGNLLSVIPGQPGPWLVGVFSLALPVFGIPRLIRWGKRVFQASS
jgi:hypothetical protein